MYIIYDRIIGDSPAKNIVHTPYIYRTYSVHTVHTVHTPYIYRTYTVYTVHIPYIHHIYMVLAANPTHMTPNTHMQALQARWAAQTRGQLSLSNCQLSPSDRQLSPSTLCSCGLRMLLMRNCTAPPGLKPCSNCTTDLGVASCCINSNNRINRNNNSRRRCINSNNSRRSSSISSLAPTTLQTPLPSFVCSTLSHPPPTTTHTPPSSSHCLSCTPLHHQTPIPAPPPPPPPPARQASNVGGTNSSI
jgi:hypothetical protein